MNDAQIRMFAVVKRIYLYLRGLEEIALKRQNWLLIFKDNIVNSLQIYVLVNNKLLFLYN